jgi:zinc protease
VIAAALALVLAGAAPDPVAAASTAPVAWVRTPPPAPLARAAGRVPAATADVRLASGLRVVVVESHARALVHLRLLFPRGSVSDPPRLAGVTWLAVHLAADYHERPERGENLAWEKSFRRQVGELGGYVTTSVQPDFSSLGVSGYSQDLGKYLGLLGEAVREPRHGPESYSGRRNVLLDWIEDLETSDPAALERVVVEAAFGADHPYSRSVIGTRESLGPLGLEDVVAHQEGVLSPEGATLLVVGDVSAARVLGEVKTAFAGWAREALPAVTVPPPAVPAGVQEVAFLRRMPASTLVACVTRPLPDVAGSEAAVEVLAAALGEGMGSRLSLALREAPGLTYTAGAAVVRRRAASALVACAPIAADRAEEGLRLFRATLDGLRAAPLGEAELRRAKALRQASREEAADDLGRAADAWIEAIALRGGAPRLEQERAELERVTAEQVRRVAATVLRPDGLRWVLSGDPAVAARAVQANRLGRLVALQLRR